MPSHSPFARANLPRLLAGCLGAVFLITAVHASEKDPWLPVSSEELASTSPVLEPDAPAEAVFRKIDVDDSDYPETRTTTEYVRYKIFDPEKVDRLLQVSQHSFSYNGEEMKEAEMGARLTLPDGSTKIFGAESIHERDMSRNANSDSLLHRIFGNDGLEQKEKFLAVSGVTAGSVLEFRLKTTEYLIPPTVFRTLQMETVPTRELDYVEHTARDSDNYTHQMFLLNTDKRLKMSEDKKSGKVAIVGTNLPSLRNEPFSGAPSFSSTTEVSTYTFTHYITIHAGTHSQHFKPGDPPWVPISTVTSWLTEDRIELTRTVKAKAAELIQNAGTDLEKARRIHDYVQQLYQKFTHHSKQLPTHYSIRDQFVSMDKIIDFEKSQPPSLRPNDFLWLAISLYRAAGLKAEVLMLPDLSVGRFDRRLASMAFLEGRCAAILIGGQWHFSFPQALAPLAFDTLPWWYEGQEALLARDNKQDFIEVPPAGPEQSVVGNTGEFSLAEDGTLTGDCKMILTGQHANRLRQLLHGRTSKKQIATIRHRLVGEMQGATVKVDDIAHIDDPYEPLEVSYTVTWPGFASLTGNRLILRPFVFRTGASSPFATKDRINDIYFPFQWQEQDRLTIKLPEGFQLEAKVAPPSHPGKILSHTESLGYDAKNRMLHVKRDFLSTLGGVPASNYPKLKGWYDAVAESDQHELVIFKPEAKAETTSATATTAATP